MIDAKGIMEVIPHRPPFLMVDRIESCEPARSAVGYKDVDPGEPYFQGHFPGAPVMPGVLIIESIAQVGAYALLAHEDYRGSILYFTGIRSAKFKRKVLPGDTMRIEIQIDKIKLSNGFGRGTAYVDGEIAVDSEFSFFIDKRRA